MLLQNVHGIGNASDRPAASSANIGQLYHSSDTGDTERSNGSTWESYGGSGGGGSNYTWWCRLYKNGSPWADIGQFAYVPGKNEILPSTAIRSLTSGDVITFYVQQDSGSDKVLQQLQLQVTSVGAVPSYSFAWVNEPSITFTTDSMIQVLPLSAVLEGDSAPVNITDGSFTVPATGIYMFNVVMVVNNQ